MFVKRGDRGRSTDIAMQLQGILWVHSHKLFETVD